jgi:hypothetical protein
LVVGAFDASVPSGRFSPVSRPHGGSIELVLSALGVLLTAIGVGHQLWKARRRTRPDVEVKISYVLLNFPTRAVGPVMLEVVNHSDHPIQVAGVGFDL